jgi:transcriptional regulator with GAF, ATPase, and Fis domain
MRERGDYKGAERYLSEAKEISDKIGVPKHFAWASYELAELYRRMGDRKKAEEAFQEALKTLQDLLGNLPPELGQSFRAFWLFRRVEDSLGGLQRERAERLDRVTIDQELLLMGRMEAILHRLLQTDELIPYMHLLLENAIGLSMAKRGALLIRREVTGLKGPSFLELDLDKHKVELSVASLMGLRAEDLEILPKDHIKDTLTRNYTLFSPPFVYIPLAIKGRVMGEIILELEGELDQLTQKVLEIFITRGVLVLDRLYMMARLKDEYRQRQREMALIQKKLRLRYTDLEVRFMEMGIVGHSESMQKIYELVEKVVPLNVPVLIQGETGTGKELIARAIHLMGPRKDKPFLAINCAAIPETLLDSELFGYMKGAFTGADRDHQGLFESAHKGTLFLDEIEEMSDAMQKKLLRSIEDNQIRRVGGTHSIHVDVRIICATNRVIEEVVKTKRLREDLFYRLNIARINLPPLRERKEDIPLLVSHLLDKIRKEKGIVIRLEPEAIRKIQSYSWPGNVRELENFLLQLALLGKQTVRAADIQLEAQKAEIDLEVLRGKRYKQITQEIRKRADEIERSVLERLLKECNWQIPAVSKILDLPQSTLYRRLKYLQIKKG